MPSIEALTKLASELTDRLEQLENENAALKNAVQQAKSASERTVTAVVPESVAQATCDALVKAGALTADQCEQVKQAYMSDPEAVHRTVIGLLDAQKQAKSAASEEAGSDRLSGGRVVSSPVQTKSAEEDCVERLQNILGIY